MNNEDPREILLDLVQRGSTLHLKDWPDSWSTKTVSDDFIECSLCGAYGYLIRPKLEDHKQNCPFVRAYNVVKEYYD